MRRASVTVICLLLFIPLLSSLSPAAPALPDLFGRDLPARPVRRIVSLAPSTTEMLFALGLEGRIVGVTSDCNYPPAARTKPRVGRFAFVNREKLVSLHPDLIVAPAELRVRLEDLQDLSVPILGVQAPTLPAMFEALRLLGNITGQQRQARQLVAELQRRTRAAERAARRRGTRHRVFFYLWPDPLMTAGTNSFIGDLIRRAGGENIAGRLAGEGGMGAFSLEQVVAGQPQTIVVPRTLRSALEKTVRYEPWSSLPAVRKRRVIPVEDDWISRPGPRAVRALEQLQRALAK